MRHVLPVALLPLLLAACGGGTAPAPSPAPGPTPAPAPGNSTLTRAQIAACPNVSGSPDVNAPTCLKGTVVGKTLGGEACTLTIKDGGSYAYAGKTVTLSYMNATENFNFFAYSASADFLLWSTSSKDRSVGLKVEYNNDMAHRMQIDVDHNSVKETCVAQL
ncbi:hypothetical protein [Deinococcus navajonensis]|uniref:Uncharacterized protein n=1 Tax=Deinococcus navajonensis TaxID=309884 RepID=A0ABV8XJD4_9DEIO